MFAEKMCFISTNSQNHWRHLGKCQKSKRLEVLEVFFFFLLSLKK